VCAVKQIVDLILVMFVLLGSASSKPVDFGFKRSEVTTFSSVVRSSSPLCALSICHASLLTHVFFVVEKYFSRYLFICLFLQTAIAVIVS